jgi:hypothetical protein
MRLRAVSGARCTRACIQMDHAREGGGGMPFVVKVILACIIVVLFLKYFVQIRLVPQSG